MMTARRIVLLLLGVLAVILSWYSYGPRTVPAGQPPLATLDRASLESLRSDFNRARDSTRIIVLLSPT
jgi:hypothetical protein